MKSIFPIQILYFISAAYDGLLGLAFLAAGPRIYAAWGITPPNHWAYVSFPAGILVIFGYLFLQIALHPIENRNLVQFGVLLKICYIATIAWYSLHGGLPALWQCFAVADTVFALCFLWSLPVLKRAAP